MIASAIEIIIVLLYKISRNARKLRFPLNIADRRTYRRTKRRTFVSVE